ncbi:zinc finger and BTB domain-containing protein 26-like isoform X2 [Amphiprion ocellaris]|uniref:Zinc finger and BTB domain containing 26 n=1 Tax=Amphiprion ocellaris TaxID=80972 RepID=A0A3Q1C4Q9_AMPOC|nr:zinc finger and BTB domain-containing protein 26-like isoform X2 [Amphiprion ocellaris]
MSLQNKDIMSASSDTLQFSLSAHGDSMLSKMNILREECCFCDITLVLGDAQGPAVEPFHFHGHRAVLAASSDFLRDQFLLHEGRAELRVSVVSSVKVAETLLLSCYTGQLEVPLRELVSYLTAASALQMGQVVEKCVQAVSQFLSPTLAFLKLERHSEKEKQLESSWLGTSFQNHEEEDAAQPITSIQEANIKEGGAAVIQSKLWASQETKVDSRGLRETVEAEREECEDAACCLDTLELEEGGDIQLFHANNQLCHVHHIEGPFNCKLHPPASFQDQISSSASTIRRSSAAHEELVENAQNQREQELEQPLEEENVHTAAAQLQQQHGKVAEDSGNTLVQRPYLCRRCDKVFQHLESYVGHLKEHRQYFCLVCEKGFSQKSNLTRHVRVHAGDKPFRCPLCHKTFTQKAMLQDHLDLHTGDRPHRCNYTAVHFAHKAGLRCHLRANHGKSSWQNVLE